MTLDEFYNIKVESRWLNVYFYGKRIKSRFERNQLLMRLDSVFSRGRGFCGNNDDLVDSVRNFVRMPNLSTENISVESFNKSYQKWFDYWGADYFNGGYNLFTIYLISSNWMGGPWSWFNPKNGKIKGAIEKEDVETLGKYKDELEWFISEFPSLDFYIYFTPYKDDKKIVALHLHDGEIEVDDTITKIPFNSEKHNGSYPVKRPFNIKLKFFIYKKLNPYLNKFSNRFRTWLIDIHNVDAQIWLYRGENYYTYNQLEYLLTWWYDCCRWYIIDKNKKEEENKKD